MTFVIVTGGIDLSVGAIVALAACFATKLAQDGSGVPVIVAILVGLITGVACGAIQWIIYCNSKYPCIYCKISNMYNCPWYCICIYRWTTDYRCF